MNTVLEKTVEKIVEKNDSLVTKEQAAELKRMTEFRLSDAIREGASVTDQAYTWEDGDALCALSGAVASAKARGYL